LASVAIETFTSSSRESGMGRAPFAHVPYDARWIAGDDRVSSHIARNDCPGCDQCPVSDGHWQDRRSVSDRCAFLHNGSHQAPSIDADQGPIRIGRARPQIVRKHHTMPDKHFALKDDALAQKTV
jgi:hypothetical protein